MIKCNQIKVKKGRKEMKAVLKGMYMDKGYTKVTERNPVQHSYINVYSDGAIFRVKDYPMEKVTMKQCDTVSVPVRISCYEGNIYCTYDAE